MPESTPDSLFRFLLFRPPALPENEAFTPASSTFARQVVETAAEHGPHSKKVKDAASDFTRNRSFLNALSDAPLGSHLQAALENLPAQATASSITQLIQDHFGKTPKQLLEDAAFATTKTQLTDSLLAIKFAKGVFIQGTKLLDALRLLHTAELLATTENVDDSQVQKALKAAFTLEGLQRVLRESEPETPTAPQPKTPDITSDKVHKAIDELKHIKRLKLFEIGKPLELESETKEPTPSPGNHPIFSYSLNANMAGTLENTKLLMTTLQPGGALKLKGNTVTPTYSPNAQGMKRLSKESLHVLKELQPDFEIAPIWSTVNRLQQQLPKLNTQNQIGSPIVSIRHGEPSMTLGYGGMGLFRPGYWGEPSPVPTSSGRVQPAGVGDLLVVRQQIKRYEAEEVAQIENILRGTTKERTHRRLDISEEFFAEEVETTRETEREFSTTERFELQDETSKTLKEDTSVQVGVALSVSYGPTVSFSTSAQVNYNRMQEETARHASSYSKDVVDRSVERMSERVTKRREQRFRREVEERNLQSFSNPDGNNISGVYQWVSKIYEAQVFNYGKRLMFDFVVPEPAAFVRYALFKGKEKTLPQPPETLTETANDLNEGNYATLAARYGATGIAPPPEPYITVSEAYDQTMEGGVEGKRITRSATLTIREGYKATDCIMDFGISKGGEWWFDVWVGRQKYQNSFKSNHMEHLHRDMADETETLPVGIHAGGVNTYTVVIEVLCEATETAMQKWRLETFEKIYDAYQQRMREYEDAIAALEARSSKTQNIGRNPATNRRTERAELKKACISLMTEQHFDLFDAMRAPSHSIAEMLMGTANIYPQMNFNETLAEGPYIRFFENAFEWEQMTYVFYPYFWGRKAEWIDRMLDQDVDPQFEEFLKAGAARSVVPVRPGFEEAVLHFLETGEIWDGADSPPEIGSPLYVSLVTEIKERTNGITDIVPIGEPWEVRVPTDLLHLRADDKLPRWEKQENGTWLPVEEEEPA